MTTSEPTTGEIVRALRVCDVGRCIDCNIDEKYPCENLKTYAADRLKSQEQTIAALTARAEQAEAGEKAVIAVMNGFCQFCEHYEKGENEEPCRSCESVTHDGRESKWTWRGQPQEGEGKK